MPYKKYPKRRVARRQRNYNVASQTALNALKALALARNLRGMLNVERKLKETDKTGTSISTSPSGADIITLVQGTSNNTREGDQIKVVSIYFRYVISMHASATDTSVRILLVQDKQCNGTAVSWADVLSSATSPDSLVAFNNLDNKYRFNILYDRVHQMSINGRRNIYGKFYKKCAIKVRYSSNLGTVADINTNNLAILWVSDEASNTPAMELISRVRYVDN